MGFPSVQPPKSELASSAITKPSRCRERIQRSAQRAGHRCRDFPKVVSRCAGCRQGGEDALVCFGILDGGADEAAAEAVAE